MLGQPPSAVQRSEAVAPLRSDALSAKPCRAALDWTAEGGCPHISLWPAAEKSSGSATSVCSTSCSSSASRTSGQASSRTCAIAAGSSLPTSSKHRFRQHAPHLEPPAPGALRAERRPDRRRDSRSEFRARTAKAQAYRPRRSEYGHLQFLAAPTSTHRCPSPR